MARISYEVVAPFAQRLYEKVLTCKTEEEMREQYRTYVKFLESMGWTNAEFDNATLELINEGWDSPPPKILN